MTKEEIELLQRRARADGADLLVGALIVRNDGRLFAQRRSRTRKLFPGCWDVAGGHVELGEWLTDALRREILEETGWSLSDVVALVGTFEWYREYGAASKKVRELIFIVRVQDPDKDPQLEDGIASDYRWLSADETGILFENREPGDDFPYRVYTLGFNLINSQ